MPTIENKRIAKNTAFLYMRLLIVLAINLYTTRVVLSVLGIEDYGIYNVVCGFVSLFSFLNNSLANGTQRFYNYKIGENKKEDLPIVFTSSMSIQIVLAIILLLLLETIGVWYLDNKMVIPESRISAANWVFQCSVISLVFLVLQVPYSAAVLAFEKMNYYALISIVDAVLKLLIVLVLPIIDADHLQVYGILTLLISVINFLLYVIYCNKKLPSTTIFVKYRDKKLLKEMTSFSGWNVFGTFAYMIKDQGLNVLLNLFFGPVVNAARGVSMQVNSALQGFSSNIVVAIRPQLVQSYSAGNTYRVQKMMFSMSKMIFLMLFVLSLPIMIELPCILDIWLSGTIPENTIIFTDLVLVNMIISSMNTPLSQVVHATGKMRDYQVGTSLIVCSILPISWIFLKCGYPAVSVFVVSIVVSIFNQVVCLFLVRKIFTLSIKRYLREVVIPCLVLSIVSPLIPLFLHSWIDNEVLRLLVVSITSVCIVVALGYSFVLNKTERQMFQTFIITKLKR